MNDNVTDPSLVGGMSLDSIKEEFVSAEDEQLIKKYDRATLYHIAERRLGLQNLGVFHNKPRLVRMIREHFGVSYAEQDKEREKRWEAIREYGDKVQSMLAMEYDFTWELEYRDGSKLQQYDERGVSVPIDLSKPVKKLSWIPYDVTRRRFDYELDEGEKPIIVRRTYVPMGKASTEHKRITYLIGGEKIVNGKNVKNITYIMPSFTVMIRTKDGADTVVRPMTFPGSVERSGDKNFMCAMDKWCRYVGSF